MTHDVYLVSFPRLGTKGLEQGWYRKQSRDVWRTSRFWGWDHERNTFSEWI